MTRLLSLLLALFLPLAAHAQEGSERKPVTILISIDGFRADYLGRGLTPNLSRLADEGAHGTLRPSFPTKPFPNHYALVTGQRDRQSTRLHSSPSCSSRMPSSARTT